MNNNNKILVSVYIPVIEEKYDVFIPIGRKVKKIIHLASKAIADLSTNYTPELSLKNLYNKATGDMYDPETIIKDTDIKNGTKLILFCELGLKPKAVAIVIV